jgi:SAM-dependent methyltransferase
MANPKVLQLIEEAWLAEAGTKKRVLDLSCGDGKTSRLLSSHGFEVVATWYVRQPNLEGSIYGVAGVNLNRYLPFRADTFDGVNLIEVIEHIENQAQLIREFNRVLRKNSLVIITTPNILNMSSRLRFLFTGFLRGRSRPLHYTKGPEVGRNIYLIHFYELYYLLTHNGFEVEALQKRKVRSGSRLFMVLLYPFLWLCSAVEVILKEKDPVQRRYNRQVLKFMLSPALLLSDNLVVIARKK